MDNRHLSDEGVRAVNQRAPVLSFEEWAEAAAMIDRPPTPDDVWVTLDGRRLDTKEKVLAHLAEGDAIRASGRGFEPD